MPSLLPVYIYFSVLKLPRTSAAVPSLLILWKQSIDLPLCSTENVQVTSVANQFSFNLTNFDDPQAFLFSSILLPQLLLAFQSSSSSSNRVMPPSFLLSAQPETGAAKRGARWQHSRQRARLAWTSRLLQCDGADCIWETQPRLLLWALFPFAALRRRVVVEMQRPCALPRPWMEMWKGSASFSPPIPPPVPPLVPLRLPKDASVVGVVSVSDGLGIFFSERW